VRELLALRECELLDRYRSMMESGVRTEPTPGWSPWLATHWNGRDPEDGDR